MNRVLINRKDSGGFRRFALALGTGFSRNEIRKVGAMSTKILLKIAEIATLCTCSTTLREDRVSTMSLKMIDSVALNMSNICILGCGRVRRKSSLPRTRLAQSTMCVARGAPQKYFFAMTGRFFFDIELGPL